MKIRDLKLPGIKLPVCSVAGLIRCSIHRIRLCPDICPLVLVELMIFVVFCNLVLEFQGDRSIFCSSMVVMRSLTSVTSLLVA